MQHYYTADPEAAHEVKSIPHLTRSRGEVHLMTDRGVFSRDQVDYGTRVLLAALPPLTGSVLDLGCGYGPIGLTVALDHPGTTVTLADVNRRALGLAGRNAEALGVPCALAESDGFAALPGVYDAILTNPPIRAGKEVYYPWFAQAPAHLAPGGLFVCVVQKKQGAPSVKKQLLAHFGNCTLLARDGGYWVLAARAHPTT